MKTRIYSTFTIGDLKTQLGLTINVIGDFSSFIVEVELNQMLQATYLTCRPLTAPV